MYRHHAYLIFLKRRGRKEGRYTLRSVAGDCGQEPSIFRTLRKESTYEAARNYLRAGKIQLPNGVPMAVATPFTQRTKLFLMSG